MNTLRIALVLFALSAVAPVVRAADEARIRAILVTASNEKGQSDRRLAAFEPTLRRILRFESYRYVGEGSVSLAVPGKGPVSLGDGHRLDLDAESAGAGGIRVNVRWSDEGRVLMQSGLSLRPGVPAVLGGPRKGDGEVYAVIVIGN